VTAAWIKQRSSHHWFRLDVRSRIKRHAIAITLRHYAGVSRLVRLGDVHYRRRPAAFALAETSVMAHIVLDDFEDVSDWLPVASGLARLTVASDAAPQGKSMRLDFDFAGGGGFVVARKATGMYQMVCAIGSPTASAGSHFDRCNVARALKRQWSLLTKLTKPLSIRSW
jgi:hypothetical protein